MSEIETFFLITVNTDGTYTSYSEMPEVPPQANRPATTYDVYTASKQIAQDFDQNLLADLVVQKTLAALSAPQPSNLDKIRAALKERGIDPESTHKTA
jgi:hypothetical protein